MLARIDVFDIKDIQHAVTIIEEFQAVGIADVEEIKAQLRAKVQEHIDAIDLEIAAKEEESRRLEQIKVATLPYADGCPECGCKIIKYSVIGVDSIATCVDCRWSAYLGENYLTTARTI